MINSIRSCIRSRKTSSDIFVVNSTDDVIVDSSVCRISEWKRLKSKAPRGVRCGEGVSPPHWGGVWERGLHLHFFASKSHVCDAL